MEKYLQYLVALHSALDFPMQQFATLRAGVGIFALQQANKPSAYFWAKIRSNTRTRKSATIGLSDCMIYRSRSIENIFEIDPLSRLISCN